MNNRLQNFLNAENLTQSQFADSIGVARASVSHILNGRNKPGFEFIENVARKYPALNLEWLITGKGKMYLSPDEPATPAAIAADADTGAATDQRPNDTPEAPVIQELPGMSEAFLSQETQEAQKDAAESPEQAPLSAPTTETRKEIEQIIIFFKDGTYEKVY